LDVVLADSLRALVDTPWPKETLLAYIFVDNC
jgi:hypothetical protein